VPHRKAVHQKGNRGHRRGWVRLCRDRGGIRNGVAPSRFVCSTQSSGIIHPGSGQLTASDPSAQDYNDKLWLIRSAECLISLNIKDPKPKVSGCTRHACEKLKGR
jgi:hypothetical protein